MQNVLVIRCRCRIKISTLHESAPRVTYDVESPVVLVVFVPVLFSFFLFVLVLSSLFS